MKMSVIDDNLILKVLLDNNHCISGSDSESSSSNSSLSDISYYKKRCKKRKIENYIETVVRAYDEHTFKSHFRLSRKTAYELIGSLERSQFLPKHTFGRSKLSGEKVMLLTLWYLANQNSFREIADRFGVSLSSAHNALRNGIKFLLSKKGDIIKWPSNDWLAQIKEAFSKDNGIPGAIGAVDGSHVEIHKPKINQDSYINRKGYHSLLIQGVVDHTKKFLDVFCGEPGSIHDARLLRKSGLYCRMMKDNFMKDNFLLGDTAYPNLSWIVTPFKDNGNLTYQQKLFNQMHCSKRVVVENSFALLKGRFRRLKCLGNLDLNLCSEIILAACILHNICLNDGLLNELDDIKDDQNQPGNKYFTTNIGIEEEFDRRSSVFNQMFGT